MRYAIFSDIHANLEAFQMVLRRLCDEQIDRLVCLGDVVGYGAKPNETIELLRSLTLHAIVRGNHDRFVFDPRSATNLQTLVQVSNNWTRKNINAENRSFLKKLPKGPVPIDGEIDIVHGSPHNEDFYILSDRDARKVANRSNKKIIFFGHTHIAVIFAIGSGVTKIYPEENHLYSLSENKQYLINPGSIGQPRDLDARASFLIFDRDEKNLSFRRVRYDVRTTQEGIKNAGLPLWHATRLAIGR